MIFCKNSLFARLKKVYNKQLLTLFLQQTATLHTCKNLLNECFSSIFLMQKGDKEREKHEQIGKKIVALLRKESEN